jgi:hypothetical protein
MRAAPCVAAITLLVCVLSLSAPVKAAQPAEFQTLLDNIQALKVRQQQQHTMHPPSRADRAAQEQFSTPCTFLLQVPGVKGTVGEALKGALTGWEYTLPLEFVRKGQAYVGPSLRLRRVMNDLMAGEQPTDHPVDRVAAHWRELGSSLGGQPGDLMRLSPPHDSTPGRAQSQMLAWQAQCGWQRLPHAPTRSFTTCPCPALLT